MKTSNRNAELAELANRARQLTGTMSHGQAVETAIDEAINFGFEKKADKWTLVSLVSTLLTNSEIAA